MNKKIIRLTESDLHRIIKESVNKVLNEVQFGGESFHGDNPTDWAALADLRLTAGDINKDIYNNGTGRDHYENGSGDDAYDPRKDKSRTGQYDDKFDFQRRSHYHKSFDDMTNAATSSVKLSDLRNAANKGQSKANRVKKNFLKKYMNQPI